MTRDQLEALVLAGESESQEFKQTTGQRTDGTKTICAMLNQQGGRVLFGVMPDGKVQGQQVVDKTLEQLTTELQQIDPPAFPSLERIPVDAGREALVVTVSPGQRKPYTYKHKAYRRVGNSTLEMTRDEYNHMLLEQVHAVTRWENEPASGWTVEDLDGREIVLALDEAIQRGRADPTSPRDPADILRGFGLVKERHLLRAAVLLFARQERLLPDFPQALLRVARFKGTDRTEFLDNRQFRGHAFELMRRAEQFMRDNLPIAGRVVPNLFQRQDDPLYPPLALREALANAFCHRDYSIGGGSVGVGIYDDRLEVTSSGTLHFGLTVEDLFRPHESLPWNPLIAQVFYRRGIIEAWGRGTLKMAELTTLAGLPRPEIEDAAGGVTVRFRPSRYSPPQRIGHDLTRQQQMILVQLAGNRRLALREIVKGIGQEGVKIDRVKEDLSFLRGLRLVDYQGHGKGARWFLVGQTG